MVLRWLIGWQSRGWRHALLRGYARAHLESVRQRVATGGYDEVAGLEPLRHLHLGRSADSDGDDGAMGTTVASYREDIEVVVLGVLEQRGRRDHDSVSDEPGRDVDFDRSANLSDPLIADELYPYRHDGSADREAGRDRPYAPGIDDAWLERRSDGRVHPWLHP